MCKAAWLSQNRLIGYAINTPKDARRDLSQINSLVTMAMARYSASADDRETVVCFFVFHEIGDRPMVTKYPVSERRVRGQAP